MRNARVYGPALRFLVLLGLLALGDPALSQINACKYLVVSDFTSDLYGIAPELRKQAGERGFTVISAVSEAPGEEAFKICVMSGSWSAGGFSGRVSVRVQDPWSKEVLGEASTGGTNWWGIGRTVRNAVGKLYSQLGYRGFNDDLYRERMRRLYPPRPKLSISEDEVKKTEPTSHIQGIWSDPEDQYRMAIVSAPEGSGAQYLGVILQSHSILWQSGEIKAEFRSTASPNVFTCTYFLANKKPAGTTVTIDHRAVLRGSVAVPNGQTEVVFFRVWPSIKEETGNTAVGKGGGSGTGFLFTKDGLIATNWHVVADAKHITVNFPGWNEAVAADVVIRDVVNDLAVLRPVDSARVKDVCREFPYQLTSSTKVSLGEHVSTIGYPLTSYLGSNPKFTEGVVSSKTGLQDDPRSLQISAQVQPGSSGSPLFDADGNVIGVVVATIDVEKLYEKVSALPQNINWAIKSDYLLNLIGMLPGEVPAARTTAFTPEKAARCVATIRVW